MSIKRFSPEFLGTLIEEAGLSPRSRQHRNIHRSYEDPCQRFLNAIGMDSYIRPHRHSLDPKAETLVAVRGTFALVIFDDGGAVQEMVRFGTEKYGEAEGLSVGVDLPPGTWHTIMALVPGAVLLELKAGPFDSSAAKEPAPWAPEEGSVDALPYLQGLRDLLLRCAPE
jgi:cupin fold WbuC family metalloprotein